MGFVPQQHGIAFENPLGNTTLAPPYGIHGAQCGDPMGNEQSVLPSYFEQQSVQPTNQTNQCWQEGSMGMDPNLSTSLLAPPHECNLSHASTNTILT